MTEGAKTRARERTRDALRTDRWFALLASTRILGVAVAVALLIAHDVTDYDGPLALIAVAWTAVTLLAFGRSNRLRAAPAAWLVDTAAALGLVLASGDWRSPFYIFALTTLILPGTGLRERHAVLWGAGFSLCYLAVASLTGALPAATLESTVRLETLATHLFVPIIVVLALAHAGHLVERLRAAQVTSERLAVQAERQRIAWELHDSAKQRVHAAHLLLSALDAQSLNGQGELVEHARGELRAATADMETSVAELRAPLDGRPVGELLRERASVLERIGTSRITVDGHLPELPPLVATHAYRIAAEAMTNAVRHAGGTCVVVTLSDMTEGPTIIVRDDGAGLPPSTRAAGTGMRSMRVRAETIGAALDVGAAPDGPGTVVRLVLAPLLHPIPDPPGDPQ